MMKWIFRWVVLNIVYVFVGSFAFTMEWVNDLHFAVGYYVLLALNLVLLVILWRKHYLKRNIVYILMAIFAVLSILATILAVNVERSIFGDKDWREGLLVLMYYFSLMAIGSTLDKKYKKKTIIVLLVFGAIECAYGVCQAFRAPFVKDMQHYVGRVNGRKVYETWSTGFAGNPNFFSTLVLICIGYAISLFVDEKPGKKSAIYLALVMLFACGIIVGNTMSCVVGLAAMMILLLIFTIKHKKLGKIVSLICVMVAVVFMMIILGKTTLVQDVGVTFSQASKMAQGDIKGNFGTNRIYIWQNALEVAPNHLWHGTGIDGFCDAFPDDCLRNKIGVKRINKAHNEYLQILITEGIFALVVYLAMCGIIVCRGVKDGFKNKTLLFVLPVIGYLVQAFFNISVITVAPLFFLAMGLCVDTERKGKILVVGNFGEDNKLDGQTAKTRAITKTLKKICGEKRVRTINTKKTGFLEKIRFGIFVISSEKVVILPARKALGPVTGALGKLGVLHKTYYVVIGGCLYDFAKDNAKLIKSLKKMKCVLVETNALKDDLSKFDVDAKVIPNYRIYNGKPKLKKKGEKYVYYSRVIKEKGVLVAIDAVRKAGKTKKVYLDIYGPIGDDFRKEFEEKIKDDKYVQYCGVLNGNNKILGELSQYKCLLLPTTFNTEGVPGAVVEAMAAGVPVIVADWRYSAEIVSDKKTGIVLKNNTVDGLARAIKMVENGKVDLGEMSKNCIRESEKHSEVEARKVLKEVMDE